MRCGCPLRKTWDAMPAPKRVVAIGACAISGGVFGPSFAAAGGVAEMIPVDVVVPGCPPPPLAILHALLVVVERKAAGSSNFERRPREASRYDPRRCDPLRFSSFCAAGASARPGSALAGARWCSRHSVRWRRTRCSWPARCCSSVTRPSASSLWPLLRWAGSPRKPIAFPALFLFVAGLVFLPVSLFSAVYLAKYSVQYSLRYFSILYHALFSGRAGPDRR